MAFRTLMTEPREQHLTSWASGGLLVFVSAFLWAPTRDGLQGIYVLAFFLPMLIVLFFRKPNFNEYGGWPTIIALIYAGFCAISTLWGEPRDFYFFILQWFVLATWLCGSCLIFSKYDIDIEKYLRWFVMLGALIVLITILYYYCFIFGISNFDKRLRGWNVFRNANEIGAMCGIITLLALNIALQTSSLKRAYFFYIPAFIAGIGLVASFSRGALLAFIPMAFLTLILVRPPLKIWLPPAALTVVALLVLLITSNIFTNYTNGRTEDFGSRYNIWKQVFDRCHDNIFIGIGMAKDTSIIIPDIDVYNHAHNAWLDTLYRTGFAGLILVLLHLKEVLQKFSASIRILPLYTWLGYGCICSLFDGRCFFWEIGAKWFLYWIPIGLIVATQTGVIFRESRPDLIKKNQMSKIHNQCIHLHE